MKSQTRNFHVPLPEQLYLRLQDTARRQKRPATQLAKQAVEYWLAEQEKLALHEAIAAYAAEAAGTDADLDETLEEAGVDLLTEMEPHS